MRSTSKLTFIRSEPSSSEGLGGISPAGSTYRFWWRSVRLITSEPLHSPASRLEMPLEPSIPRRFAKVGRRISHSSTKTNWPASAMEYAKFKVVVDFPSPRTELVTPTTRHSSVSSPVRAYIKLVRSSL